MSSPSLIPDHRFDLYEGKDWIAEVQVVQNNIGVEINLRTRDITPKWTPLLALSVVNGRVAFALNGPRVRKGSVDGSGNTVEGDGSDTVKDKPAPGT